MPKLIAKERFFYAGRNIEANEEFEAEQNDVALLMDAVSPRARLPEAKTESVSQPEEKPKRRYTRRDMRADNAE